MATGCLRPKANMRLRLGQNTRFNGFFIEFLWLIVPRCPAILWNPRSSVKVTRMDAAGQHACKCMLNMSSWRHGQITPSWRIRQGTFAECCLQEPHSPQGSESPMVILGTKRPDHRSDPENCLRSAGRSRRQGIPLRIVCPGRSQASFAKRRNSMRVMLQLPLEEIECGKKFCLDCTYVFRGRCELFRESLERSGERHFRFGKPMPRFARARKCLDAETAYLVYKKTLDEFLAGD